MSIATAVWAQQLPDAHALSDERSNITWRDLDDLANRTTNALLNAGFTDDQRVAVFAENATETVIAHLAGILAGISTVPINFHLTAPEYNTFWKIQTPGYCLSGRKQSRLASKPLNLPVRPESSAGDVRQTLASRRGNRFLRPGRRKSPQPT